VVCRTARIVTKSDQLFREFIGARRVLYWLSTLGAPRPIERQIMPYNALHDRRYPSLNECGLRARASEQAA